MPSGICSLAAVVQVEVASPYRRIRVGQMQERRALAVTAAPVALQRPARPVAVAMAVTPESQALEVHLWAVR